MAHSRIRLLVVDDAPAMRKWISTEVGASPQFEVVGEAGSGEEALEKARLLEPDLVLMDIGLPGIDGLEATRRLVGELPGVQVLILTLHNAREYILRALEVGARGYLLKTLSPDALIEALSAAARGERCFSPEVAPRLVQN